LCFAAELSAPWQHWALIVAVKKKTCPEQHKAKILIWAEDPDEVEITDLFGQIQILEKDLSDIR
jgi:hypothetical protein